MNSIENKLQNNFKTLRKALEMTQVEFAKNINVTNSYISSIEKGISKNVSDQVFNSIELKYGIKQEILAKGSTDDIKKALGTYSKTNKKEFKVAQPESEYDKHGGWTPQTKESDWGCIPKVVEIVESDTIYSKALLQNIDAFYQAVMAGKNRRKDERRKENADYDGEDRRKEERRRKTASGE